MKPEELKCIDTIEGYFDDMYVLGNELRFNPGPHGHVNVEQESGTESLSELVRSVEQWSPRNCANGCRMLSKHLSHGFRARTLERVPMEFPC